MRLVTDQVSFTLKRKRDELKKALDMLVNMRYNEFIKSEEWFFTLSLKETDNMTAKNTLGVTTNVERSTYSNVYYIIQAFKDCNWQDVLFSRGDIFTAEKKARHYRNKNDCETRVIEVKESVSYSYDYSLVTEYSKNDKAEN